MLFDVYKCFLPECYLDTLLVEVLLNKPFSVNHKKGNSSIAVVMNNSPLKDRFAVGIIDEDKVRLKELDTFIHVERLRKNGLKIYRHSNKNHFFIQICPAVERWILKECEKASIDIAADRYRLPNTLKGLKAMKGLTQRSDERFKRLFRDMSENESCDELIELRRWLLFFRENNYNSNLDLL
ncbi:MAG: hypothetical protein JWR18_4030 [Segetibacter sp.]|jgi:hypothetical protein|nr:hypothetical protein [Segetibacter sp.]